MADASSTLSIVLKFIDEATSALSGVSKETQKQLDEIQGKADQVRNTFGLLGGAIIGGLGVLFDQAANSVTADMQLTNAVKAGIDVANQDTAATGLLSKQKQLLQSQLDGLNGKMKDYKDKIDAGNDSNGAMASSLDLLQQKAAAFSDKLETLNNEQNLAGQNAEAIVEQFKKVADANTALGFQNDETIKSLTTLFRATGDVNEALSANQEAMDLARAKHIDLSSSATLVIQAMEGNGRALKQFGINLKDGLTPAEALIELQQKLANSAQDYVNTPWGQLDVAKAKVGLLAETLGGSLLPVLANFLQTITPIIQKMADWANEHPKLTSFILLTVGAVGILSIGIAAIAQVVSSSISLFNGLSAAVQGASFAYRFLSTEIVFSQGTFGAFALAAAPWLVVLAALATAAYLVANAFMAMQDAAAGAIASASQLNAEADKLTPVINNAAGANKTRLQALQDSARQTATQSAAVGQRYTGAAGFGNALLDFLRGPGGLQQFDMGGIVQGYPGEAVPVIAHAGERIIPAGQAGKQSNGSTILNFHFHDAVVGDDGIKQIITKTIQTFNRATTLRYAGV